MFQSFLNIFKVPELRNKVLFTLFLLAIYRVGFSVPLPGVDQAEVQVDCQSSSRRTAAALPDGSPTTSRCSAAGRWGSRRSSGWA